MPSSNYYGGGYSAFGSGGLAPYALPADFQQQYQQWLTAYANTYITATATGVSFTGALTGALATHYDCPAPVAKTEPDEFTWLRARVEEFLWK